MIRGSYVGFYRSTTGKTLLHETTYAGVVYATVWFASVCLSSRLSLACWYCIETA